MSNQFGTSTRFDLESHLRRQLKFSLHTFGPEDRTAGVLDHIRKEIEEIAADPFDLYEWIDLSILAFDGVLRVGHSPSSIVYGLEHKQTINEGRKWPDWRTMPKDRAIEHVRN